MRNVGQATNIEELTSRGVPRSEAEALLGGTLSAWACGDRCQAWRYISQQLLTPAHPFGVHQLLHQRTFAGWDSAARGPAPVWSPSDEEVGATNVAAAYGADFAAFQRLSVAQPEVFWRAMLTRLGIVQQQPPAQVIDLSDGVEQPHWMPGMRLNIAESALASGAAAAVVWQAPGGALQRVSRAQLAADVARFAGALRTLGLGANDRIAMMMPMSYLSVVGYLSVVSLGAAVVSIADSFAAEEVAVRLRIANAAAVLTQDVIVRGEKRLPLYPRVTAAKAPRAIVASAAAALSMPLRDGDVSWQQLLAEAPAADVPEYHYAAATHTTNVLFSSGTTGEPKAIAWTQLTPIKAATDGWAHQDIRRGDVVCWPTNLGWMMGPWLIYASLLNGATIALYEGSPLTANFGAFVQRAGVTMLGVVPSLVKAWRRSSCLAGCDWSTIRCFSSTGEVSSPEQMHWLMARAGYKPVIEYCGGTEIGGGYISGSLLQPQLPGAFSTPAVGCDFVLLDSDDQPSDSGQLCLRPPLFGSSQSLLNRDHHEVYYAHMPRGPHGEVLRRHGDYMQRLPGGYYRALGRVDDTMNLGGIKVSSAEIERVCDSVPTVHETAAIAVSPKGGGPSQLLMVVVLNADRPPSERPLKEALQAAIGAELNPLFKVARVEVVERLPRTASNKVMRRVLRQRYGEVLSHSAAAPVEAIPPAAADVPARASDGTGNDPCDVPSSASDDTGNDPCDVPARASDDTGNDPCDVPARASDDTGNDPCDVPSSASDDNGHDPCG